MLYSGAEDQCFFNSRCLTNFWPFHDFARVFTNIGYLVTGGAFVFIVQRHQKLTQTILDQYSAADVSRIHIQTLRKLDCWVD